MKNLKVVKVNSEFIQFENGVKLSSNHDSDCFESHELALSDLTIADFEGLEFDLTDEKFFNRITDYGIELIPLKGHSVKIAGHGHNNGYYSDTLELVLSDSKGVKTVYDITECQDIDG